MQYPNQFHGPGNGGPGADMTGGFATCAAAMVSIIVTPAFTEFTMPYVVALSEDQYSYETVDLIAFAWQIIAWPMTFYAARARTLRRSMPPIATSFSSWSMTGTRLRRE